MRDRKEIVQLRDRLAMVKTISNNAKRQSLSFGDRFLTTGPVRQDSGQIGDFTNPASVFFSVNLDPHDATLPTTIQSIRPPRMTQERMASPAQPTLRICANIPHSDLGI